MLPLALSLSVGVIVGTVALALAADTPSPPTSVASSLPRSLFEQDARPVRFGPVGLSIADELPTILGESTDAPVPPSPVFKAEQPAPTPSPSSSLLSPSPSPSPVATPRPKTSSLSVELAGNAKGEGSNRSLSYEGKLRNTGSSSLPGVEFLSHIPSGTKWMPSQACSWTGYAITVTYEASSRTETVCIPGTSTMNGSNDPGVHPVRVKLSETLTPGTGVTVQWLVEVVGSKPADIVNDAHAWADGLRFDSGEIATSVR
ncbi:MAG: hypothetical protein ABIS18_10080 [Actinomycetota bacterium]